MVIWPAIPGIWRNWGYIRSYKQFIGRKPNTTFSVTPEGKEAFKKHLNALENFLKNQLE